jgi:tetratricopeptide (TPR) repeat protein
MRPLATGSDATQHVGRAARTGAPSSFVRAACSLLLALLTATLVANPKARAQKPSAGGDDALVAPNPMSDPVLGAGFRLLYQLKFDQAREGFAKWEQERPADPLGPALEAASDLFEEFYRKGVLTSEFFLDNKRLLGGIKDKPDAGLELQFASAVERAEKLAHERLGQKTKDPDALFTLTLIEGMQADDFFLIQRRQLESLRHLREGDRNARMLLQVAPDSDDAYVALGAANYIIGCLPGYKRAALWMGGVHGDKALGMQQLSRAASSDHAHYLRPYARLMLALAALRERNSDLARQQLQTLVMEFPENPLFATELAKVIPVVTSLAPTTSIDGAK